MSAVETVKIVVDILSASFVLVITLMKTARHVQQASIVGIKAELSAVLLRDGKALNYQFYSRILN